MSEPVIDGRTAAPVRLRGHHLLCMLTFKGLGYTEAFSANMRAALQRIAAGAPVEIIHGPDELCSALEAGCGHESHCSDAGTFARDSAALEDMFDRDLVPPGRIVALTPERIAAMRAAFRTGAVRRACSGCEWKPICDDIVANRFAGTVLPV